MRMAAGTDGQGHAGAERAEHACHDTDRDGATKDCVTCGQPTAQGGEARYSRQSTQSTQSRDQPHWVDLLTGSSAAPSVRTLLNPDISGRSIPTQVRWRPLQS